MSDLITSKIVRLPRSFAATFTFFVDSARELRYSFFQMCLKKYNAEMVLVGHHQDDLLQTYLMQNKTRSYVNFYGIKEVSCVNNVNIYRPLLSFSKQELLNYDIDNNVPY